ncbi:MAG TPA: hypothetical protein VNH18_35505 [Bryobacteraceae bacterium]|nr:hypothetical protein [Bryobacteraceae bacterium]
MRRASILFSVFAFCAAGLIAQDADLIQHQTLMKAAAGANAALRAAVTAKDAASIKENSGKMAESFDAISKYWARQQKADAVKFAEDARDAAKAVGAATEADQAAALGKINGNCRGCHMAYREGNTNAFKK